jgi:hypothetical protein
MIVRKAFKYRLYPTQQTEGIRAATEPCNTEG